MTITIRHIISWAEPAGGLNRIEQKLDKIMTDLTELTSEVEEIKTVSQSAIVLLNGLKQKLDAAGTDPVKLKELSQSLDANSQELAAAVSANTTAEA